MKLRSVKEFFWVLSVLGIGNLRRLSRARRWGWEGILRGHFMARAIQALLNVGLLDALQQKEAIDVIEFAEARGLDSGLLVAVCDYLYGRRLLHKHGTRFSLDKSGRLLAEMSLLRGWFHLAYGYEPVLHELEALLRKEATYGKDVVRDGRSVAVGSGQASADFYFPLATDYIRRARYGRVLDIGCGDGTFLAYLSAAVPGVRGVGIDLSAEAVEHGRASLTANGLGQRIELYQGDAFEINSLKAKLTGVDAAVCFFVLHELFTHRDRGGTVGFLRAFRETLPNVPITVFETIRPSPDEMRARPGPALEYYLFHDLSGQTPIGQAGWRQVFHEAGFASVHERYLSFARTAIYTAT